MSEMETAPAAEDAIARLKRLPSLTEAKKVGLTFVALVPEDAGELGGHEIKLSRDVQHDIGEIAQETRNALVESTLLTYEPAVVVPDHGHRMHVPQDRAAVLADCEREVRRLDLPPFHHSTDMARIKMVCARFTTDDGTVVTFYRVADAMLQLKESKLLGLVFTGSEYTKLEPANVLLLRRSFDVVVVDGYAFFEKKATFERSFGFLDELKRESKMTFKAVTKNLRIRNMDELEKACTSQPAMMAKMASIKRSMTEDAEYANAMTMERLVEYIKAHRHIDIEVRGAGPDAEMVFDPAPRRRFQIVKLLDDDFLRSTLTARQYEAGSKVRSPGTY